eukprot:1409534-Rhodomonas_salina.1
MSDADLGFCYAMSGTDVGYVVRSAGHAARGPAAHAPGSASCSSQTQETMFLAQIAPRYERVLGCFLLVFDYCFVCAVSKAMRPCEHVGSCTVLQTSQPSILPEPPTCNRQYLLSCVSS